MTNNVGLTLVLVTLNRDLQLVLIKTIRLGDTRYHIWSSMLCATLVYLDWKISNDMFFDVPQLKDTVLVLDIYAPIIFVSSCGSRQYVSKEYECSHVLIFTIIFGSFIISGSSSQAIKLTNM